MSTITLISYIEVAELKDLTSAAIIQFLKEQFSRHGIPDVMVSNNGLQYVSKNFTNFSRKWEFKHVTSSPTHPKSNGKSESAVKVAKRIFKKALREDGDLWLSLLGQRNTPTEFVNVSPVQRLMSRRSQTLLLVSNNLLRSRVVEHVKDKLKCKRAWLAQFERSLPSDYKVPGSIPGFAEIRIFVQLSFPPKPTQLSILLG